MPLQPANHVKITIRDSSPPHVGKFPYNPKSQTAFLDRTPPSNNSPIVASVSRANSICVANENINSSKLNINNSPTSSYRAMSRANITPLNVTNKNLKLVFLFN
jgi:hypothetical protein